MEKNFWANRPFEFIRLLTGRNYVCDCCGREHLRRAYWIRSLNNGAYYTIRPSCLKNVENHGLEEGHAMQHRLKLRAQYMKRHFDKRNI